MNNEQMYIKIAKDKWPYFLSVALIATFITHLHWQNWITKCMHKMFKNKQDTFSEVSNSHSNYKIMVHKE